jgi:quinol monooxygenase YgiN
MHHVIARIAAKTEHVAAVGSALDKLAKATRMEEGCQQYDVYQATGESGVFFTVEVWADEGAVAAHMGTPHVAEAFA